MLLLAACNAAERKDNAGPEPPDIGIALDTEAYHALQPDDSTEPFTHDAPTRDANNPTRADNTQRPATIDASGQRAATFASFYRLVDKPVQTFTVSNDESRVLACAEGTVLLIPARAFVSTTTGLPVSGPVDVRVKEYINTADILLAPLSTRTRDRLLETAGMVHIEAMAGAEPCELAKGTSIEMMFPQARGQDGMQLFTGVETNDGTIIWETMPTPSATPEQPRFRRRFVSTRIASIYKSEYDEKYRFPGGPRYLNKFFEKRVASHWRRMDKVPKGQALVNFILDSDGRVCNIDIVNSVHPTVDTLLVKALNRTPRWRGARTNNKPIPVALSLAVSLRGRDGMSVSLTDQYSDEYAQWLALSKTGPFYVSEGSVYSYRYDTVSADVLNTSDAAFAATRLGWINCDRFNTAPNGRTDFAVDAGDPGTTEVKLVFRTMRSMLNGYLNDKGQFVFSGVPNGASVTAVAIRREGNQTFLAVQNGAIAKDTMDGFSFQPVSNDELRAALAQL